MTLGGDWPQILGPARNGVASEESIVDRFPEDGPPILWQMRVGQGFAGAAIQGDRLVVHHRPGREELVEVLNLRTGKDQWTLAIESDYVSSISPDSGPRCVPLVHDGRVFAHSANGRMTCIRLVDGEQVWSRDLAADFGANGGYFGAGSSPIVVDGKLLVNVGGRRGAGIVALSLDAGTTLWKSTDEQASYSSPVTATHGDTHHVLFLTRMNLLSVDAATGKVRFSVPFGRRGPTVNGANPIVLRDHVFLSASYQIGATLIRLDGNGSKVAWDGKQGFMSSQYMTSVPHEGVLFGIDGRSDGGPCHLRAIDPLARKILWTEKDFGMATIVIADGKLLVLTEDGQLVLARAHKTGYDELARAEVFSATTRALPALSAGLLIARDTTTLKCIDLRVK